MLACVACLMLLCFLHGLPIAVVVGLCGLHASVCHMLSLKAAIKLKQHCEARDWTHILRNDFF